MRTGTERGAFCVVILWNRSAISRRLVMPFYCQRCGASLPPSARFCSNCGNVVTAVPPAAGQAACAADRGPGNCRSVHRRSAGQWMGCDTGPHSDRGRVSCLPAGWSALLILRAGSGFLRSRSRCRGLSTGNLSAREHIHRTRRAVILPAYEQDVRFARGEPELFGKRARVCPSSFSIPHLWIMFTGVR